MTGIMLLALLVLVAACANLAGIFTARVADRARELAIRLSIGSTRWRILRQVLTEAILVSLAGGVAGTLVASALLAALSRWQPFAEFPIHVTVVADARVYLIALLLSALSGVLPGLLPAGQIWRTHAMQAMKSGSQLFRSTASPHATRSAAGGADPLCALLVTAALVSLRGMERSLHAPLGFLPQGAVSGRDRYAHGRLLRQLCAAGATAHDEAAERIPGVTAVGTVDDTPLGTGGSSTPVYREGTAG